KDIAVSSAKSVASTLYLEKPELKVRVIDFDSSVSDKEVMLKVIDELQTYERFNAVGYSYVIPAKAGIQNKTNSVLTRHVLVYENSQPSEYTNRNITWTPKDVVLVTGGAKGITAQCALEFARSTKARMVLMGRSPVS
ncbi:MAG: hypothetical protein HQL13_08415, partial [Candidatus Omnitrophica bacterium]|nr:hypothetical protein [Candidatus Omnitrophota bacterium]